jgi:hypothetical protein
MRKNNNKPSLLDLIELYQDEKERRLLIKKAEKRKKKK